MAARNENHFPTIDRTQATEQLTLLGYQSFELVFFRFFYPSDHPKKAEDFGAKRQYKWNDIDWKKIEAYQREERGVYFVINGQGHTNDEVNLGRAIFCEHDDLDKDLQRDLWKTLGLPEPTFQIDTGGKSIHSYWVFTPAHPR